MGVLPITKESFIYDENKLRVCVEDGLTAKEIITEYNPSKSQKKAFRKSNRPGLAV
jgi:hypothetical protein